MPIAMPTSQLCPSATPRPQDVAAAVVLCEGVYRAEEHGEQLAEEAIQRLQRQLPAAPKISRVQWSPPHNEQR
jgi:hypothetical protein